VQQHLFRRPSGRRWPRIGGYLQSLSNRTNPILVQQHLSRISSEFTPHDPFADEQTGSCGMNDSLGPTAAVAAYTDASPTSSRCLLSTSTRRIHPQCRRRSAVHRTERRLGQLPQPRQQSNCDKASQVTGRVVDLIGNQGYVLEQDGATIPIGLGNQVQHRRLLMGAWKDEARFNAQDLALARDDNTYSRLMSAPSRGARVP